jgi:hypothetical protein
MTTHYDQKGKFFTDVVQKDAVPVNIQTTNHRIEGNIHVRIDDRLKDELDREQDFIAITEATLYDLEGKETQKTDFIIVNRSQIIWITPQNNNDKEN